MIPTNASAGRKVALPSAGATVFQLRFQIFSEEINSAQSEEELLASSSLCYRISREIHKLWVHIPMYITW
jgi:hypothetical protein